MHSISKQKGNFSIEFALLGVVFATLMIFTSDLVVKLSMQGKLDRLSYSAVNILKERTQLYSPNNSEITNASALELHQIIAQSLQRTTGDYSNANMSSTFESLTFSDNTTSALTTINQSGGCSLAQTLQDYDALSMITSWGRRASLYRVTICYETDNWAGELLDANFTTIQSSSIMMGR